MPWICNLNFVAGPAKLTLHSEARPLRRDAGIDEQTLEFRPDPEDVVDVRMPHPIGPLAQTPLILAHTGHRVLWPDIVLRVSIRLVLESVNILRDPGQRTLDIDTISQIRHLSGAC